MLKIKFNKALEVIKKLEKFDKSNSDKLYKIIRGISFNHQSKDLADVSDLCVKITKSIPDKEYYLHIEFVYSFSDALVELGKEHSKILKYFNGFIFEKIVFEDRKLLKKYADFSVPNLLASGLYLNLAARLDSIGLPGETFKALAKSFDPHIKLDNSFTDTQGGESENFQLFYCMRLSNFLFTQHKRSREILLELPAIKFKNSKYIGDLDDESSMLYSMYVDFAILGEDATQADILFFCEYAELLKSKNSKTEELKRIIINLEYQYGIEIKRNRLETARMIAYTLTVVSESYVWAETSILEFQDSPDIDKKFYSSAIILRSHAVLLSEKPDFVRFRKIVSNFLYLGSKMITDPYLFNLFKRKNSHLLNYCLTTCVEYEQFELAIELALMWKTYSPSFDYDYEEYKKMSVVIVTPNPRANEVLTIIYHEEQIEIILAKTDINLSDILTLKDEIEGTWTYFSGDLEALNIKPPTRLAVEKSNEYIEKLSSFIDLERIKEKMNNIENPVQFKYLESTWINSPIISLLSLETQHVYSVLGSNKYTEEQGEIKKVLIWANPDGTLYSSQFEIEGIEYLLSKANIDYEIVKGNECTKELFIEKYENPTYDLIWIISHAHLNYDDPSLSEIVVAEDSNLNIRKLNETSIPRDKKRYLVLNACQSSAAEIRYNSMSFESLAESLLNDFQSVLGHLWTVDSLAAAVLGVFTIEEICNGKDLATSLKLAEISMSKGREEIIERLAKINSQLELIDRVYNSSKDLSLPFHSMSAIVTM
ncbi:CHAT domain-containing protein [Exiguobacterium sp. s57]|uniref:CHAT domain-containing protein n=1 Tax=Exiguobacterium sp. s57 TaxID=2751258 RepID=UPI001BE9B2FC|nr:CHAT domain-containing protein [Exiguobacterium sp. s57]